MGKKLIIILLLIAIAFCLIGCEKDKVVSNNIQNKPSSRFVYLGDSYDIGYDYKVYYDSKTNVVYLASKNLQASGITVMYNKEGNPMMLEEYNSTK